MSSELIKCSTLELKHKYLEIMNHFDELKEVNMEEVNLTNCMESLSLLLCKLQVVSKSELKQRQILKEASCLEQKVINLLKLKKQQLQKHNLLSDLELTYVKLREKINLELTMK